MSVGTSKMVVDHISNLPSSWKSVVFLGILLFDIYFSILLKAGAIFASSTLKIREFTHLNFSATPNIVD